ncbi:hypothetical protein [Rodentibacter rarus]|uniref:hypothetical protein n=1 Tax=Rodentibacter rarus TaxID=1908260 RepID=UPI0015C33BF6|nr:hypothetical protein [Rodentibacter rarus]
MSLQILCKGYKVANHEKPILVKVIVKFMKKNIKNKKQKIFRQNGSKSLGDERASQN